MQNTTLVVHVHLHNLREQWREMSAAARLQYVALLTHLYKYLSKFVSRGPTEARISRFERCLNHLGTVANHRAYKYSLSPSVCVDIVPHLATLLRGVADEDALHCVIRIQDAVELDFIEQGWTYEPTQNFAYRTPA